MVPVPEDQLPVVLPLDAEFTPTGQSPADVTHEAFLNTTCPHVRRSSSARNRHDGYLRRLVLVLVPLHQSARRRRTVRPEAARTGVPVDLYCGGIEHAILHLLYARFFTKVLRDLGLIDHGEPFLRLRNQGMILAEEGTKMSKSRGTQVAPDELVAAHGADALRLHLMYLGPWDQGGPWNIAGITGMERFIRRAFSLVTETGSGPSMPRCQTPTTAPLRRLRRTDDPACRHRSGRVPVQHDGGRADRVRE